MERGPLLKKVPVDPNEILVVDPDSANAALETDFAVSDFPLIDVLVFRVGLLGA